MIAKEITMLLQKQAVEPVCSGRMEDGFYSTIFTVPKKGGERRPIVNLKNNNSLEIPHMKIEGITTVRDLLKRDDYFPGWTSKMCT